MSYINRAVEALLIKKYQTYKSVAVTGARQVGKTRLTKELFVFAPKYRRQVFFGQKRLEIGKILRKLCEFKQVTIIEVEVCPDHVH